MSYVNPPESELLGVGTQKPVLKQRPRVTNWLAFKRVRALSLEPQFRSVQGSLGLLHSEVRGARAAPVGDVQAAWDFRRKAFTVLCGR